MGPTSRNEGCGFRSEAAREHPSARVAFDREVEIGKAQRILVERRPAYCGFELPLL